MFSAETQYRRCGSAKGRSLNPAPNAFWRAGGICPYSIFVKWRAKLQSAIYGKRIKLHGIAAGPLLDGKQGARAGYPSRRLQG